jgi:hypothetical protein
MLEALCDLMKDFKIRMACHEAMCVNTAPYFLVISRQICIERKHKLALDWKTSQFPISNPSILHSIYSHASETGRCIVLPSV